MGRPSQSPAPVSITRPGTKDVPDRSLSDRSGTTRWRQRSTSPGFVTPSRLRSSAAGSLNLRPVGGPFRSSAVHLALDEGLDGGATLLVGPLHGRALHQVRRGGQQGAADAAVL